MPDDRTIGELARQIEGMRRDQAQQMDMLQRQMRSLVSIEYLNVLEKRFTERITDLAADLAEEKSERKTAHSALTAAMRYVVMALIAAAGILIPVILSLRGPTT